jgi:hypothetical protein
MSIVFREPCAVEIAAPSLASTPLQPVLIIVIGVSGQRGILKTRGVFLQVMTPDDKPDGYGRAVNECGDSERPRALAPAVSHARVKHNIDNAVFPG